VFDGGGIAPDIALEPRELSNITISLYAKNLIFDFATLYAQELGNVQNVNQILEFGESDYNRFIEFLKGKSYDYTTKSDDKLSELIKTAEQEKYYDLAKAEFNALRTKLAHDKDKDLQTFKAEIIELLREEIASRFYYQKGRILASLKDDLELKKAVEILKSPHTYSGILVQSYGQSNVRAGMQKVNN
jgi:carboxyl-terminal processing protease